MDANNKGCNVAVLSKRKRKLVESIASSTIPEPPSTLLLPIAPQPAGILSFHAPPPSPPPLPPPSPFSVPSKVVASSAHSVVLPPLLPTSVHQSPALLQSGNRFSLAPPLAVSRNISTLPYPSHHHHQQQQQQQQQLVSANQMFPMQLLPSALPSAPSTLILPTHSANPSSTTLDFSRVLPVPSVKERKLHKEEVQELLRYMKLPHLAKIIIEDQDCASKEELFSATLSDFISMGIRKQEAMELANAKMHWMGFQTEQQRKAKG